MTDPLWRDVKSALDSCAEHHTAYTDGLISERERAMKIANELEYALTRVLETLTT